MRKKTDFKELIKTVAEELFPHLLKFIKRLYVFSFFFGMPFLLSCMVATFVPECLSLIGLPGSMTVFIERILLTIAPIVPTGVYIICEKDDQYDNFSIDLCFVAWILTIMYAWKLL